MRLLVVGLVLLSAISRQASAQVENTKTLAEQLFKQGRELAKANRWEEACPKFEASLGFDPVLGTKLNLAACYEQVGKLASAWGVYRDLSEIARKSGDLRRAEYAEKQAAALEPRLPTLQISVPSGLPSGFKVERNGILLGTGALGVGLYVDPGPHQVVVSATGFKSFTTRITVREGETQTLAIPQLVEDHPDSQPLPHVPEKVANRTTPATVTPTPSGIGVRRKWALGAAGVAVATLATAVGFEVLGRRTYDRYEQETEDVQQRNALYSDANGKHHIAQWLGASSIVLTVAASLLWYTAPTEHSQRSTFTPGTKLSSNHIGFTLEGRF